MEIFAKSFVSRLLASLTTPGASKVVGEPIFRLIGMRRKDAQYELGKVKKVLVVMLDGGIGDVILRSSFLRELRGNLPDAWVSLVVDHTVYNLVELCPHVNEVLIYDWIVAGKLSRLRLHARAWKLASLHLWHRCFDLAIVPRWDIDYHHASFVAYFSGALWRAGYSEHVNEHKSRTNKGYDKLFTHVLAGSTLKHEVERSMDLIRFIGGKIQEDRLELWVGKEDDDFADKIFHKHDVKPGELVIGIGPSGGNSPLKQWPLENFLELGLWLTKTYHARLLVVGGSADEKLASEFSRTIDGKVINVAGTVTLRQTAAMLRRCYLYVGNDSGPLHIAAALGIPGIAIFVSSCHHRFGPWGKSQKVIFNELQCGPCSKMPHIDRCSQCIYDIPTCVSKISVDAVKTLIIKQLDLK